MLMQKGPLTSAGLEFSGRMQEFFKRAEMGGEIAKEINDNSFQK